MYNLVKTQGAPGKRQSGNICAEKLSVGLTCRDIWESTQQWRHVFPIYSFLQYILITTLLKACKQTIPGYHLWQLQQCAPNLSHAWTRNSHQPPCFDHQDNPPNYVKSHSTSASLSEVFLCVLDSSFSCFLHHSFLLFFKWLLCTTKGSNAKSLP